MLQNLFVQNYALIHKLEINFQADLTVITGETGAGKSILLGALSLALGHRADLNSLQNPDKKCIIEANFHLEKYNLYAFFDEHELDYEDNTIIRREITPKGKSRAFINDTPVKLNQLKSLGDRLIDIHSQHQNLELKAQNFQIAFTDTIAQNEELLALYQQKYNEYKTIQKEISALKTNNQKQKEQADFVAFQTNELKNAQLKPGEQEELEQEQKMLSNSEAIAENLKNAIQRFDRDEFGINEELIQVKNELSKIAEYFDNGQQIIERISSAIVDLEDLIQDLKSKTELVHHDPQRLENVNQRLNHIYTLQQKHAVERIDELLEIQHQYEQQLNDLEHFDDKLNQLELQAQKRYTDLKQQANELHDKRLKAAKENSRHITKQLADLGMPKAIFQIEIQKTEKLNNYGCSEVLFLFATDQNMTPKEVTKVASGGELSRIMLIVKSVIAAQKSLPTIIFDEIDAGVSGDIANKMGNIMKKMGQNMQIISITHLPQIAAKGKYHSVVYKTHKSDGAVTNIRFLDQEERVQAIAQMLSSENPTEAALKNAKELLTQ